MWTAKVFLLVAKPRLVQVLVVKEARTNKIKMKFTRVVRAYQAQNGLNLSNRIDITYR